MVKRILSEEEIIEKIQKNPAYLKKVECTSARCLAAIEKNGLALRHVPSKNKTKRMCTIAVQKHVLAIEFVPPRFMTDDMCQYAISKSWRAFRYVPDRCYLLAACKEILDRALAEGKDARDEYVSEIVRRIPKDIRENPIIRRIEYSLGTKRAVRKVYDNDSRLFVLEERGIGYDEVSVSTYGTFDAFYQAALGDISGVDLSAFDFEGVHLHRYNIENALISSDVLVQQGLYDSTFYASVFLSDSDQNSPLEEVTTQTLSVEVAEHNELTTVTSDEYVRRVYYISDIHLDAKLKKHFPTYATRQEVESYIAHLVNKMMQGIPPRHSNDFLIVAGDVSYAKPIVEMFFIELKRYWHGSRIITVLGNHELWGVGCSDMAEPLSVTSIVQQYRHFFRQQNIHCLHNSLLLILGTMETKVISGTHLLNMPPDELEYLLSRSWFAILGGMGFSGNNPRYNASHGLYRNTLKTIDEDLVETQRFSKVYEKLSDVWADGKLIVLTHTPFENWGEGHHNPNWIYVYGHTHRNEFFIDETKTVYADNQIGYLSENVQLKYFATSYIYDLFQKYPDGVYEITRDDYIDFNYGIHCRPGFSREGGTIIMLKKQGIYCFLYRNDTNHRLYLLNGGAWKRLEITDVNYYYDNLDAYACGVRMLFREYSDALKRVSQIIKNFGGNGRIHGSIVDIDYYNHVRLDVRTGQLIPYHAWSMVDKWEYSSVEALLQDNNPILLENIHKYLPDEQKQVLMQRDVLEPVNDVARFVPETDMYRASRIMKTIQFLLEVNVVRIWSEEVIEWYKSHQHEQASMGMLSDYRPKKIQEC